jgi:hypothetical protein
MNNLALSIKAANMAMTFDKTDRQHDVNGWYEIKRNPISKEGVFEYGGATLAAAGLDADPSRMYRVYRPASELSSQECIDSFKLIPWIDDHAMLGDKPGMIPAEQKGIEGIIGEDVFFEDGYLYGNIKVFSEKMAGTIDRGKKDLSAGYRCNYRFESGIFNGEEYDAIQFDIRGNHLALVAEGRMGKEVSVLDHAELLTITIDSKEFALMSDPVKEPAAQDQDPMAALEGRLAKIEELLAKLLPLEKEEHGEALDADKEVPPPAEEKDKCDANGMDAAEAVVALKSRVEQLEKGGIKALMGEISKRDALANAVSAHIGTFDHSEKTLGEVAKYAADKLGITCDSGHELAAVQGFLAARKAVANAVATQDAKETGLSAIIANKGA